MAKKPLSERLKTGELYFVLNKIDFDTGDIWVLVYGDRSLRIFKKGAIELRVVDIPICRNLRTATQQFKRGAIGAVLPLSVLLEFYGPRRVSRLAPQDGLATEMRAYIKQWTKAAKKPTAA